MAFGDYESWGVVLSADVTIYKLRKRVSLSLAPALSWVVGVEQVTCSPGRNDWAKAAGSGVPSKPFCITECLPLFYKFLRTLN